MGETKNAKVNISDLMTDQSYTVIVTPIVHGICTGNPAFMNFTLPTVEGTKTSIRILANYSFYDVIILQPSLKVEIHFHKTELQSFMLTLVEPSLH